MVDCPMWACLFGQGGAACRPWARARCLSGQSWEPEDDGPSHCCRRAHCRHHRTSFRVRMEQVCRCGLSINRRLAIQRSTAEQASAATQALLAQHLNTTLNLSEPSRAPLVSGGTTMAATCHALATIRSCHGQPARTPSPNCRGRLWRLRLQSRRHDVQHWSFSCGTVVQSSVFSSV